MFPPVLASAKSRHDMNRAIFLDRDGVIIEDKNYLHRVEDVMPIAGAPAALRRLQDAGFKLFIVTNQSGVGRGYFTITDVEKVNAHLARKFSRDGVTFQRIYVAPEAPDPQPGTQTFAAILV